MPVYNSTSEPDLRALFSDTTADYVDPQVPEPDRMVSIRLRVGRDDAQSCFLVLETPPPGSDIAPAVHSDTPWAGGRFRTVHPGFTDVKERTYLRMHRCGGDQIFDYYEVRFEVSHSPLRYFFEIVTDSRRYRFTRRGVRNTIRPADLWHIVPGFRMPAWAEGAVMYQIFVDRFCNGDSSNDVLTGEYSYMGKPVVHVDKWDQPPTEAGYREFYGGDLQGVIDKLDYLQDLGIEAIYLNPIFLSPSSHKYDTQDYGHIDPHFGKIVHDGGELLWRGGRHPRANRYASRYLERVTDPANLEAGDRLFAKLVRQAHARGIRVILDGVFNHCGSFHRWLDRERIYEKIPGGRKGAFASKNAPAVPYFRFEKDRWPSNDSYEAWWGFSTLPKLNYENSEELCKEVIQAACKWLRPPYCADGWRLDVAADLGHSPEFNHRFWKRFRKAVKKANPEAIILAENYTDSQNWLQGDEWDTIMNYEFFMEPVTGFFTGMEKHSDARREEKYGNPDAFWHMMACSDQDAMPAAALSVSMNQLSNHDHSRFLTRTNRMVGRARDLGIDAALQGVSMEVMRQAVLLQMTWTGAPTIYYGDEAGMGGFTDPDNRRTYPWGHEDEELIRYHRALIALRRKSPALRRGSVLRLPDEDGVLAYARFTEKPAEAYFVIFNINHIEIEYEADAVYAGVPPEAVLSCEMFTDRNGFALPEKDGKLPPVSIYSGHLHVLLPPESGILLHWEGTSK